MNHFFLSICQYCLIEDVNHIPLHIVFILHGFKANPQDMKKVMDLITLTYPHVKCVLLHKCYSNAVQSLSYLAKQVAEEILVNLKSIEQQSKGQSIQRISFIAHSIGGLVFRLAITESSLSSYQSYFHLFLSLNVPHLGLMFANLTTEVGARLIQKFTESIQMSELLLRDHKDLRQTTIYKLAENNGMSFLEGPLSLLNILYV